MIDNFCKYCILHGAEIFPLNINAEDSKHLGICNPSIFNDGENVYLTLRNVNYMLYQNLNKNFQTFYGELAYCTPDNDNNLRTQNYLAKYDLIDNDIISYNLIDTSKFDTNPVWNFIGHEDVRLVKWEDKWYVTGCRRDVKPNGESRMELCEIDINTGEELSRVRIKSSEDDETYCEKNWMPILDKPFHYIRWTSPVTEIVKINPLNGDCTTVKTINQDISLINSTRTLRGSSQIIPYKDGYIALVHEVDLWLSELERKEAQYYMKFIKFDKDFNIVSTSDDFKFLNFSIEFTNGLMYKDNYFYIPFSVMDNISFILKVKEEVVNDFIDKNYNDITYIKQNENIYRTICLNNEDPECWFSFGEKLYKEKQYAQACVCFARALEEDAQTIDDKYRYAYALANSFSGIGERDNVELSLWENCINLDSSRSEAYEHIARYYKWRNNAHTAYTFIKLAYELNNYKLKSSISLVDTISCEILFYELSYTCSNTVNSYLNLIELKNKLLQNNTNTNYNFYINKINDILHKIEENKKNIKKVI